MRRVLLVLTLAAAAAGVLVPLRSGDARSDTPGARTASALTVTTTLPAWRAPGVPLQVGGFAGSRQRVVLRANGRPAASTVSGRLGRYHVAYRPASPGRYRLVVDAAGRSRSVGTLVVRPVTLDAVGDITFGEQVGPAIEQYGASYPWIWIAPTLRGADITTGNLETAVTTRGEAAIKQYTFRGRPSFLPPLHTLAGLDVLTLANNHTVDFGRDGLMDTIRAVHAAGMQTIGAGANDRLARRPALVVAGGLRVALLGYSDVNPAGFPATAALPGTARADTAAITADVHAALRRADVAVCFFHWGVELRAQPDSRQRMLASACLNAGARLVLGAHPHVLGPVSRPGRHSLVAWTLGNFVFPSSGVTARTAILHVELDARGVSGYHLLPVTIVGFRPRLG